MLAVDVELDEIGAENIVKLPPTQKPPATTPTCRLLARTISDTASKVAIFNIIPIKRLRLTPSFSSV